MVAPLLGRTFALRRAYEEKQRVLTELQHEIDVVRMTGTPFPRRRQGLDNLEHHFRELAKAADDANELLKAIRTEFDTIHQEMHAIERQQREL
jgi:chromosome segregation ATPase